MIQMDVLAKGIHEGDTIPSLDNAYVVEVDDEFDGGLYEVGQFTAAFPDHTVLVTYHDRDGEENYLLLRPETLLTVIR